MLGGIQIIKQINKVPKKSSMRKIEKINASLTDGDWRIHTIIEMMGQTAVMATEQKVLDEVSKITNSNDVYQRYLYIYQAALPGIKSSKEFLNKVIDLVGQGIDTNSLSPDLLIQKKMNRWLPDSTVNPNF